MKKLLSLLLAAAMCLSLVSCDGRNPGQEESPANEPSTEVPAEESEEEADLAPSTEEDPEFETQIEAVEDESAPDAAADESGFEKIGIEPTVLYDDNDLIVTATDFAQDEDYSYLTLEISNNREEDIDWTVWNYTINGCNVSCATCCTVTAGATGSEEFWVSNEEIASYGITTINTISVHCEYNLTDDDEGEGTYVDSPAIVTNAGTDYDLSIPLDQYTCIYDENGLQVYYSGIRKSDYEEEGDLAGLILYSSKDTTVSVCPEDVSFDAVMNYDNFYSFTVYPDSYSSAFLVGGDLSGASEAKFKISCYDEQSFDDLFESDYIVFALDQ